MKSIIVTKKEIEQAKINFFSDMLFKFNSIDDINKFLQEKKYKCNMIEDDNIIYFVLLDDTGNEIMYSRPLKKYIEETDELVFMVKNPKAPPKTLCLTESSIPIFEYSKKRHGLVTPQEIKEKKEFQQQLYLKMNNKISNI